LQILYLLTDILAIRPALITYLNALSELKSTIDKSQNLIWDAYCTQNILFKNK